LRVYAHRGASAAFPENTLFAFRQALAAGVDGIELDIHGTADGVPVVIHDRELDRTTTGTGFVDDLPLVEVRAVDAGNGEQVPTLAEVLNLVGNRVHLDLEVKAKGIERAVLDVLARFPQAQWAISSFDWEILRELRRLDSAAELWPLAVEMSDELLTMTAELSSPAVALLVDEFDDRAARQLHEAGLKTMIWTVNDPSQARLVRDLGAFAICTDDPERIIPALHRV
jgi:glycerophosphoryl diester phosphodiesterase